MPMLEPEFSIAVGQMLAQLIQWFLRDKEQTDTKPTYLEINNFFKWFKLTFTFFQNCFFFHLNYRCPTEAIKTVHKTVRNTWITKGILVSRGKIKFFTKIYQSTNNENFKQTFRHYNSIFIKVIQAGKVYMTKLYLIKISIK